MKSVGAVSITSVAALLLASPAYASAAASSPSEQPLGSTQLASPGFTRPGEVIIQTPDASDGGAVTTFIANSLGGPSQVYLHRSGAAASVLVSTTPDGRGGNGDSDHARVAPDGTFVTYWSAATNLISENTLGYAQIYLYDPSSGANKAISRSATGALGLGGDSTNPSVSPDGRFVVFRSSASNLDPDGRPGLGLYLYEVATGRTRAIDAETGPAHADNPVVSAGGRYIAFESDTDNLVPGDTDHSNDVFRLDRRTHAVALVSRGRGTEPLQGAESYAPEISGDGSRVCYTSTATNLVPGDPGTYPDIFLADATTRSTVLVSRSADGGWANGASSSCDISADAHLVTFASQASDLVPTDPNGHSDVFVYDAETGRTAVVVRGLSGQPGNGPSVDPTLSPDGRYVAFESAASNLTSDDTDQLEDAFLRRIG